MITDAETINKKIADDGARLYCCKVCAAILGVIQRENRRTRLNVFRDFVVESNLSVGHVREIKNFNVVNLEQGVVICGHCGARLVWRMSDSALDELLIRRKKRSFGLDIEGAS